MLDIVQGGLLKAPFHRGVDRGELLFDDGLNFLVQFLQAAIQSHGKQRQHREQVGRVQGVQRPGAG